MKAQACYILLAHCSVLLILSSRCLASPTEGRNTGLWGQVLWDLTPALWGEAVPLLFGLQQLLLGPDVSTWLPSLRLVPHVSCFPCLGLSYCCWGTWYCRACSVAMHRCWLAQSGMESCWPVSTGRPTSHVMWIWLPQGLPWKYRQVNVLGNEFDSWQIADGKIWLITSWFIILMGYSEMGWFPLVFLEKSDMTKFYVLVDGGQVSNRYVLFLLPHCIFHFL